MCEVKTNTMSEENNLSSSSLCTTEDAFEKFQADAILEEDEFITLSDIVPPQPEIPDISNELNEIPYDNEVVLSAVDDDSPLNSATESGLAPNNEQQNIDKTKNEYLASIESTCGEDTHKTLRKLNTSRKKGRRKGKSVKSNNSKNYDSIDETENNSYLENEAVQDNVHSTTVDKNGIESNNDLQGESKYPRRTRRERIPNTSRYPQISTQLNDTPPTESSSTKRRGRPRKSTIENATFSEPDSTNIDNSSSLVNEELRYPDNGEVMPSNQNAGKKGRRGRAKVSKGGLEQADTNNASNKNSESSDVDLPSIEFKKSTRRGRKKNCENDQVETGMSESNPQLEENKASLTEPIEENNVHKPMLQADDMDIDDDADDICLSKLKENINSITENLKDDEMTVNEQIQDKIENTEEKDSGVTVAADFEYHIDKVVQETSLEGAANADNSAMNDNDESLLVEDTSKRPNRRKAKKNFKYDVDSDEDPFANVELSDDEPIKRKKGRYADDDEYIPGNRRGKASVTSSSESELNEDDDEDDDIKLKRKKIFKNADGSPKKRGKKRKYEIEISKDDICTEDPVPAKNDDEPLSMKPPAEAWATSNEFENFIAQKIQCSSSLKIKKVSSKQKTEGVVAPLEIPVINQNEPKKFFEIGTQTTKTPTTSSGMQTSVPYDIPMKVNLNLTSQQSEKACAFLNSVVKTTAELGQLMKNKSEDFMKKKINTDNVTDTFKMDYCVRKSFLLFKLAKHNLMQMEEDLAKQYDEFLKTNELSSCREEVKNIAPKPKVEENDSDCEIVNVEEVPSTSVKNQTQEKPKLNKTVFLNKELSIKIAKKPSSSGQASDKNVDAKGRHTIWINDSVMVKKVKPTQSFLAQDSRNKKPPDCITEKMVSDFFENYYRQNAAAVCAPYISTEWSVLHREYACYYFVKCSDFDETELKNTEMSQNVIEVNASTSNGNCIDPTKILKTHKTNPKSLVSLCTEVVRNCLYVHNVKGTNEDLTCDLTDGKNRSGPLSLFRLCYESLPSQQYCSMSNEHPNFIESEEKIMLLTVPPLKTLCYKRILQLMPTCNEINDNRKETNENLYDSDLLSDKSSCCEDDYLNDDEEQVLEYSYPTSPGSINKNNDVKSLLSLCVKYFQTMFSEVNNEDLQKTQPLQGQLICPKTRSPKLLKIIAYDNIKYFMFGGKLSSSSVEDPNYHTELQFQSRDNLEDFTINCINTMSEEAFHSLEAADAHVEAADDFQDEDEFDYEPGIEDFAEDDGEDESEWASQVQMQVLTSCVTSGNNISDNDCDETAAGNVGVLSEINPLENEFCDANAVNHDQYQDTSHSTLENINILPQIKLEPQDDIPENIVDPSIVKTEPIHVLDGMTIIPESIVTKSEMMEQEHNTGIEDGAVERESATFDVNSFEQFVRKNKMMRPMDEDSDDEADEFGQTGMRVRREHEPDYDAENEMNESLLIPQTYEPLNIDNAKGVLMESSSDESKDGAKKQSKKKTEKKRTKQKKVKEVAKNTPLKEVPTPVKEIPPVTVKEKTPNLNEVAVLTRRMREKIRQEEKKIESSDSETDNVALSLRKDKNKAKENEKVKPTKNSKQGESSSSKNVDNEIQCNAVDSTDQTLENRTKRKDSPDEFTGFSAIDQNEISSYQKFMQFVYDKIVPTEDDKSTENNANNVEASQNPGRSTSPLINLEQPVELLECEPTMPIFDDESAPKTEKRPKKVVNKKKESKVEKKEPKKPDEEPIQPNFTEQDGWHIYDIDPSDMKLYQKCHIPLEKLPESFVDTYLEYHDITNRDNIDKEVDRLVNLQTLNRATSKEGKSKNRQKVKSSTPSEQNSENVSRVESPANSDCLDELTPSEDEGANVDDEEPPPVPVRATENNIAKNSLMDDYESDSDGETKKKLVSEEHAKEDDSIGTKTIKQENIDEASVSVEERRKPGPKSKTKMSKPKVPDAPQIPSSSQPLMLTADKMMNKELNLLHAPIVMTKEEPKEVTPKEPSPKDETKPKKRSSRNVPMRDRLKTEDDSSSEEEKQWVTTKEKLLKRIGKKEDATADDAKRAKLVDDFIERRGEGAENRRATTRSRRSRKKMLEKLKQQRVLSKELLGEPSIDLTPGKRGANVGLFKGRRNIRKVIDKKSLQKSTVLANMEEFERKRRLNSKLNQLRELLGCEEGVNVLVINDEVCLEYDFQEQRPVVTVHPFFTKVMKAHQYEGVKFMWDACFESLASIEAGHPGGGCILAHCMGLGKTLQVLALLHTVLTHPRVGMQRVLVCCPLSTVLNWVDEIHKWIGPVTDQIKVFELSKLRKTYERAYQLEDWYNGGGIFIIGYELFRSLTTLDPLIDEVRPTIINKIRTALLDPGPDIIICDEGHLLKNDCSVLAVAMSRVVTRRRIVLTGTPMQNNLREYYCMVNFVKPNLLGTYSEYSNRFENPIMNGQHRDSREEDIKLMKARTHILHKVLEGCLQRQEASVLYPYLPKKHEYTVFIPLTKCQWDLYKHYVHHYTMKSKQSVLRDFHILQKIWSHPLVLHNFSTRDKRKEIKPEKLEDDLALEDKEDIKPPATETWWLQYLADGVMLNSIDSSNKFVAVFRILDECLTLGDKVLIFSTSLDCLDALEYFLRQINGWNLGQEYYRLDGSVPAEVRQKWVREYNAENNLKTKLFLISTRAGCLGLNMTAANRVIILDTSWNPAHDIQSIFRVYRFGQKKDCYIYRLVAMGTMEQKIYERSVTKQAVACRVVDEQQIDRHYNMAELTELYRFDEHGVGVAGGVAVGVGDVALLRVARDAAIHAVHEHDSLLRGSGEQGLPEHERAAAWMQFQQEHATKQMQNDLETDKANRAMKKLQQQELMRLQLQQQAQLQQQQHFEQQLQLQQQMLAERQQAEMLNIKTEDEPVPDLLVPRQEQPAARGRGGAARRGRGRAKIVQCRIPIKSSEQPGPSHAPPIDDETMVEQISNILIKYNYTETRKGPAQVQELVARVKRMLHSGQTSFEGCDALTASIAAVLMQRHAPAPAPDPGPGPATAPAPAPDPARPMPALTNVECEPRRRGRPRKSTHALREESPTPAAPPPPPPPPAEPEPQPEVETGGRRRRRAALIAERQFDENDECASQDSVLPEPVIELDDDDWHAHSDTDSAPDAAPAPAPAPPPKEPKKDTKQKAGRRKKQLVPPAAQRNDDSSILLSDDEPPPVTQAHVKKEKEPSPPTPLHPSLLSNQNFIKIVAHTYLAGNPMLDEDAATLAAQYSTFKLLKEAETTNKPIDSGPIYDIALKVLGLPVLQKLQQQPADSKSKGVESNAASSKMAQFLGQDAVTEPEPAAAPAPTPVPDPAPAPAPTLAKRKPGPRSRVKPVKEEPTATPKQPPVAATSATQQKPPSIVPISLLRRVPGAASPAPRPAPPAQPVECILPDDDDVSCITDAPPPTKLVNFKVKLPAKQDQTPKTQPAPDARTETVRVTSSGPPAPAPAPAPSTKSFATICLDSDDEEPTPAPPARSRRAPPAPAGPVPVALTGPNSQPIPLAPTPAPASAAPPPEPRPFYPYPAAVRYPPQPVPVSLTGPDSRPVPISLTGPDNRPVPISFSGPGFQAVPISMGAHGPQAAVASLGFVGPDTVPMSYASGAGPTPMTYTMPRPAGVGAPHPVGAPFPGAAGSQRTMRFSLAPGQATTSMLNQMANNIYLVPSAAAGERLLTRVPPSQLPPQTTSAPATAPAPTVTKTYCKPGDILRLTPSGKLEIIRSSGATPNFPDNEIHTIDDDEQSEPAPVVPTPASKPVKAPIAKPSTPKPSPSAPKPTPIVPKPSPSAAKVPSSTPAAAAPAASAAPPASVPKSKSDEKGRRKRIVSTSSSSSDSSRSPSPSPCDDPLSILKDVVHIQAPTKSKTSTSKQSSTTSTEQPSKQSSSKNKITPKNTTPQIGKGKHKDDPVAKKLCDILSAAKSKKSEASANQNKSNTKDVVAKIKDSIDLTEISFKSVKASDTKKTSAQGGKLRNSAKNEIPTTIVGTSKSIVLDGRSKSLSNKDSTDLTGKKAVQVTNVKTIPSSSANKSKPPEKKRPAPSADTATVKKKKTEPLTLKDFDIDDIDDIIELD